MELANNLGIGGNSSNKSFSTSTPNRGYFCSHLNFPILANKISYIFVGLTGSQPFPSSSRTSEKKARNGSKNSSNNRNNHSVISVDSERDGSRSSKTIPPKVMEHTVSKKSKSNNPLNGGTAELAVRDHTAITPGTPISHFFLLPFSNKNLFSSFLLDDVWKTQVLEGIQATNTLLKHLIPSKKFIETCLDKNLDHFRNTVRKNLTLPLTRVEDVGVLNTALIDIDLSVSLVIIYS